MNLKELTKPFPAEDIEWRVQSSGKKGDKIWALVLAYVTARAIEDRLDAVCGMEGWQNDFKDSANGGTLCGISIKCGDEWITKWDGAGNTEIEAIKGGYSGAMKRAGSQWGIGRYLYNLPVGWADISSSGKRKGKTKEGEWFKWNPPELPTWALPEGTKPVKPQDAPTTTQPPKVAHTPEQSNDELLKALKVKLGKKMEGLSDDEKKGLYAYSVADKPVTAVLLQGMIDNYDTFKEQWEEMKQKG